MSPPQGLTEPQVLTVARGLLAELARVHDAGGVSGALGPATVLVDEGGAVRLVGGQVDPVYASPEVLAGQLPTVRSDLYSAGAVLAHLFRGEPTVPPMVTDLDPGIAWLLGPVLAADPGARPGSAAAMRRCWMATSRLRDADRLEFAGYMALQSVRGHAFRRAWEGVAGRGRSVSVQRNFTAGVMVNNMPRLAQRLRSDAVANVSVPGTVSVHRRPTGVVLA